MVIQQLQRAHSSATRTAHLTPRRTSDAEGPTKAREPALPVQKRPRRALYAGGRICGLRGIATWSQVQNAGPSAIDADCDADHTGGTATRLTVHHAARIWPNRWTSRLMASRLAWRTSETDGSEIARWSAATP